MKRMTGFVVGSFLTLGCLPATPRTAISRKRLVPSRLVAVAERFALLFPVTLAYLIIVQRAMDARVVLRQSVQYLLASN
jgi:hypothetical protein